jgi:hypothetical protein
MPKRFSWQVATDRPHQVVATFDALGKEQVLVDDVVVSTRTSARMKIDHQFEVGPGHPGQLEGSMSMLGKVDCRLVVDGREVPGKLSEGGWLDFKQVPAWAWLFVVACGSLVILGGAIGGALGAGGAMGCAALSQRPQSLGARLVGCALITGGVWLGYILIAGGLGHWLRR